MKSSVVAFLLIVGLVSGPVLIAQPIQRDSVNVQETAWQFAKMALIAQQLIEEAQSTKEYVFITTARRYIKFAENNLQKIEDRLTAKKREETFQILEVLRIASESGTNLSVKDGLALAITQTKIDQFVREIFRGDLEHDNSKGQ